VLNYTALDFETANNYRGSPCAVGLVRVRDGLVVDERHWLIRPPEAVDWFAPFNMMLHGITPEMVADAPRWRYVLPAILDYVGDDVVVAHNAGFDVGVIRYACAVENIEWPAMKFLCTLVLARRAFALPAYGLPFVTDVCGFTLDAHHDPLAEARAVVGIVNYLADREGASDVHDLAPRLKVRVGHMESGIYKGSVCTATGNAGLVIAEANPDADPDGYLYGRAVVFTGALMSMTRQMAWDEVVRAGGVSEKNTTKRTNVLVLGDFNPAHLRPGATYSGRARKAFELQDKGQDIELMTEDDFLRVLEGDDLSQVPPDLLGP
jgi:DNA polymerase III epsilon subunit-like protein